MLRIPPCVVQILSVSTWLREGTSVVVRRDITETQRKVGIVQVCIVSHRCTGMNKTYRKFPLNGYVPRVSYWEYKHPIFWVVKLSLRFVTRPAFVS